MKTTIGWNQRFPTNVLGAFACLWRGGNGGAIPGSRELGGMRRLAFHPAILRWMLPEPHTTQPRTKGWENGVKKYSAINSGAAFRISCLNVHIGCRPGAAMGQALQHLPNLLGRATPRGCGSKLLARVPSCRRFL